MLDLINTSEESHYENYRLQQMETRKFGEPKVKKVENPKFKEEEEAVSLRFPRSRLFQRAALIALVRVNSFASVSRNKSRWKKLDSDNGVRRVFNYTLYSQELTLYRYLAYRATSHR